MAELPQLVQELLADGADLRISGNAYRGPCPFHHDTKPSFEVTLRQSGYWRFKCWSTNCGVSGGLREYRKLTGRPESTEQEIRYKAPKQWYDSPSRELLALAAEHYNEQLLQHEAAVAYLRGRGVDPEMAKEWGVGYAPGNTLYRLLQQRMSEDELSRCALLNARRREDRSTRRIIFPNYDEQGRPGWHTGRAIDPDAAMSYKSLPGRRPALLMLRTSRNLEKREALAITEGPMDLLATLTAGLRGAATAGNPEPHRLRGAISNMAQGPVYVVPDRDSAGTGWAEKVTEAARTRRRRPLTIKLPESCGDPAETMSQARIRPEAIYGTAIRMARWKEETRHNRDVEGQNGEGHAERTGPERPTEEIPEMAHMRGPQINFFGNLTRDPENIARDGNDPIASFRVAVNYRKYSREEREYVDAAMYLGCTAFGASARMVLEMREGDLIWGSGNLEMNEGEGRDGEARTYLNVTINDVHKRLEWAREDGATEDGTGTTIAGTTGAATATTTAAGATGMNAGAATGTATTTAAGATGMTTAAAGTAMTTAAVAAAAAAGRSRDRDDERGGRESTRRSNEDDYNGDDSLGPDDLPF